MSMYALTKHRQRSTIYKVHTSLTTPPHLFSLESGGYHCLQIEVHPSTPFLCICVLFYTNTNNLGGCLVSLFT